MVNTPRWQCRRKPWSANKSKTAHTRWSCVWIWYFHQTRERKIGKQAEGWPDLDSGDLVSWIMFAGLPKYLGFCTIHVKSEQSSSNCVVTETSWCTTCSDFRCTFVSPDRIWSVLSCFVLFLTNNCCNGISVHGRQIVGLTSLIPPCVSPTAAHLCGLVARAAQLVLLSPTCS